MVSEGCERLTGTRANQSGLLPFRNHRRFEPSASTVSTVKRNAICISVAPPDTASFVAERVRAFKHQTGPIR